MWLWQIVVSAARDAGRLAGRRRRLIERLMTVRPVEASEAAIPDSVTNRALLTAVRALRPRDRALIALRFGADLDYTAVGAALGMSAEAAGVAGRRAVARLRKQLTTRAEGRES